MNNETVTVALTDVDILNLMSLLRKEISRLWKESDSEALSNCELIEQLVCIRQSLSVEQQEMMDKQESSIVVATDQEELDILIPLITQEITEMSKSSAIEYFENLVYLRVLLRESTKQGRGE